MIRIWIIGSGADCDIVVAQPRVSGHHCRFTELADGHLVEDLGSSNGTYVNGERITAPARVSAGDRITMGAIVPMPWPPASGMPGATVIRIGRVADNDIVLDDPRVSSHHARLIVSDSRTLIEDTGSANGTFVNSPDMKATQAVPLGETDTVYFGSLAVPAARLLPVRTKPEEKRTPIPPPIPEPLVPPEPVMVRPSIEPRALTPWTIALLAQTPVIAILILLFSGRQSAAASWPAVAQSIASTTFALALAAVWLGGSLAAWGSLEGGVLRDRERFLEARLLASPGVKIVVLGVVSAIQCAVLLAIVHWGIGLEGPWLAMFGVLFLASAVGVALGLVVFSLLRTPKAAVAILMGTFLVMASLGRWNEALPAAAMPSRWAFEGLLLLESERRAPPAADEGAPAEPARDLAEPYFPAGSERMGAKADAMALGFMLIGLAAAAAFISSTSRSARSASSND